MSTEVESREAQGPIHEDDGATWLLKTLIVSLTLLALLGIGTWFFAGPHLAMWDLWSSIESENPAQIDSVVDFEELRESVRAGIGDEIRTRGGTGDAQTEFAAALGEGLSGTLIDRVVTPEGLRRVLQGRSEISRYLPDLQDEMEGSGLPDFSIRHRGIARFDIVFDENEAGREVALEFRRALRGGVLVGLRW